MIKHIGENNLSGTAVFEMDSGIDYGPYFEKYEGNGLYTYWAASFQHPQCRNLHARFPPPLP
jgi:hypothetical protein